jgi:hypothetical protein
MTERQHVELTPKALKLQSLASGCLSSVAILLLPIVWLLELPSWLFGLAIGTLLIAILWQTIVRLTIWWHHR